MSKADQILVTVNNVKVTGAIWYTFLRFKFIIFFRQPLFYYIVLQLKKLNVSYLNVIDSLLKFSNIFLLFDFGLNFNLLKLSKSNDEKLGLSPPKSYIWFTAQCVGTSNTILFYINNN